MGLKSVIDTVLRNGAGQSGSDVHPQPIYNTGVILLLAHEARASTFIKVTVLMGTNYLTSYALFVIINYLSDVWGLSITHAAGIINIWNGITPSLTIVFAVFADSFIGSFYMLMLSCIAYSTGLGLLALSTPVFFGQCKEYKEECIGHKQKVLFFTALTLISVGQAGHVASLPPFIDAQRISNNNGEAADAQRISNNNGEAAEAQRISDNNGEAADAQRISNNNEKADGDRDDDKTKSRYILILTVVLLAGVVGLPYIKPWSLQFGVPALCSLTATGLFLTGFRSYKPSKRVGNPLTTALRVFVAAASKHFQQVNDRFKKDYNDDKTTPTSSLKCLDKASKKFPDQAWKKTWTLCTVREVEDTKIGIRMVPMCLTFIVIGLVSSLRATYFIQQADHMNLKQKGKLDFPIPFFLFLYASYASFNQVAAYWKTKFPTSFSYAPRSFISMGMVFSVLCCITAATVETQRLNAIRNRGLLDKDRSPKKVSSLTPQFLLLAVADGMVNMGFTDFLYLKPKRLHRCFLYVQEFVMGLGTMASVLLVYVVGKVSEMNNHPNWFQHSLNKSRLDLYYWTLAAISAVNLVIYVVVACFYHHESPRAEVEAEAMAGAEPEAVAVTEAEPQAEAGAGAAVQIDDGTVEQRQEKLRFLSYIRRLGLI